MRMSIFLICVLGFVLSCAKRLPPPGKPELEGPHVSVQILESLEDFRVPIFVDAHDESGIKELKVFIDGRLFAEVKGERIDTFFFLQDSTVEVKVLAKDNWDNVTEKKLQLIKK